MELFHFLRVFLISALLDFYSTKYKELDAKIKQPEVTG